MTKRRKKAAPPGEAAGYGLAFEPTEEQREAVCKLVSFGTTNKVMSRMLQIPERTLTRHFAHELKNGREIIHARVGLSLTEKALSGTNLTAEIYYSKAQMGWRERHSVGIDGKDGELVNPAHLFQVVIT
jgi:hypothetical protein